MMKVYGGGRNCEIWMDSLKTRMHCRRERQKSLHLAKYRGEERYPMMPSDRSIHVVSKERGLTTILNSLVSKAFKFMETVLTYVRRIVIWWLFLNFGSQVEKNGV